MTLSEYLIESVASRKTGKYRFPYGDMTLSGLCKLLEELGYKEMPAVKGNLSKDYLKAQYMGRDCYFTYRDCYYIEIVVTSKNDKDKALAFDIGLYSDVHFLNIIGKNGKSIAIYDAEEKHKQFVETVEEFFRI